MLFLLFTAVIVTLITYLSLKPLIDNLFYAVPHEPKYIHSYVPFFGFAFKMFDDPIEVVRSLYTKYGKTFSIRLASQRWVYLYDEQTYLTKVLKSPDLSIEELLNEFVVDSFGASRQSVSNEDIQIIQRKQFHQYLSGDELEILNKRVHDSLIESMKLDRKIRQDNETKIVNLFDHFGELMLYAGTEGLFGHAFVTEQRSATTNFYKLYQDLDAALLLSVLRIPFRSILYKTTYENHQKFIKRFSSLKLNNGESKLINAREELYRSDAFKHLFTEYDIAAFQAAMLWSAVTNTAPMSCWVVVDLLLHPEALEAVKQELKENISSSSSIYEKETLAKLKILDSCITESLRRMRNSTSQRLAMTNTTVECLDNTTVGLRKGDMLVYPAFLKHFDPNLFGPNPYEYQYDRFVKKPNQPKAPSVMHFGCGTHMCPGRFWAINEIKMLVALIIQHMDIEFVNMAEQDKVDYRKKLPYDYSKLLNSGGPKKGYKHKFDIRYSYKTLDME